ncbi:hypothetical protein [Streptomyces albidoflavus]|uniref:hypothetical protein n=1 Tax=Streptomyces albidoflavus TaxID=1886 RepID=UPI0033A34876
MRMYADAKRVPGARRGRRAEVFALLAAVACLVGYALLGAAGVLGVVLLVVVGLAVAVASASRPAAAGGRRPVRATAAERREARRAVRALVRAEQAAERAGRQVARGRPARLSLGDDGVVPGDSG